jgi:hypothetical protein
VSIHDHIAHDDRVALVADLETLRGAAERALERMEHYRTTNPKAVTALRTSRTRAADILRMFNFNLDDI